MISISNIAKEYGDRTLFSNVSAQINLGDRCGLVGANGSGKTNCIEAISLLHPGKGLRSAKKNQLLHISSKDKNLISDWAVHAKIENEAAFVGQGHSFQIWNPNLSKDRQKESRQRLINKKKTLSSIIVRKNNE